MAFERYARGLIPATPDSVPDFTNTELLKVERTIDSLYSVTAALSASAIANIPAGTIAATNVQAAINELDGTISVLTASAIANVPAGTIAAADVQAALNELDTEKAAKSGATFTGPIIIPSPLTIGGSQVLTTRQTGWTADTGTAKRTANATYAAGTTLTFSAAYVQSELTALATRLAAVEAALQDATQENKALKDDLITHGIIG